jgi:hypothetical protein
MIEQDLDDAESSGSGAESGMGKHPEVFFHICFSLID